jgi:hypothetical protein
MPEALSEHVNARLWLALGRAAHRVSWVGARLSRAAGTAPGDRFACRLDAWVRGVGAVTAAHVNEKPGVAVDRAAALLKRAVDRNVAAAAARTSADGWCDDWRAARVWEDDGGQIGTARNARKPALAAGRA